MTSRTGARFKTCCARLYTSLFDGGKRLFLSARSKELKAFQQLKIIAIPMRIKSRFSRKMLSTKRTTTPLSESPKEESILRSIKYFTNEGIDERIVRGLYGTRLEQMITAGELLAFIDDKWYAQLGIQRFYHGLEPTLEAYRQIKKAYELLKVIKTAHIEGVASRTTVAKQVYDALIAIACAISICKGLLKSSDLDEVAVGAECLGRFRAVGAVPELVDALNRFSNIVELNLDLPPMVDALRKSIIAEHLDTPTADTLQETHTCESMIISLGMVGTHETADIADALRKMQAYESIIISLGMVGTHEAVDCLLNEMAKAKANDYLKKTIVIALGLAEDKRALPSLWAEYDALDSEKAFTELSYCILQALAKIGDLDLVDLLITYLRQSDLEVEDALFLLSKEHPDEVFEAVRNCYLQVRKSDKSLRNACIRLLTAIHSENLKKQTGEDQQLGRHEKEWGYEVFEILERLRMGWTTMYFKPRTKASELDVKLNEESDLSHHFRGEGDEREFCYSTSFHLHTQKQIGIKVAVGRVKVVYDHDKKEKMLEAGDNAFSLAPGVPHQIINIGEDRGNREEWAIVTEIESPAHKNDIIRLENPYKTEKKASGY